MDSDLTAESNPLDIAQELYAAYSQQAMGVTFNGHPLPTWHQLGTNRQECWVAATRRAKQIFSPSVS